MSAHVLLNLINELGKRDKLSHITGIYHIGFIVRGPDFTACEQ